MGVGPKTQRVVSTVTPVTGVPGSPLVVVNEQNSVATDGFVTVGVTSVTVSAINTDRLTLEMVNDSTNVIYVRLGSPAIVGSGIRLNRRGGYRKITNYTGIVTAISTAAGRNLTTSEVDKP